MQSYYPSHPSRLQRSLKHFLPTAARRLFPHRIVRGLIVAASLVVVGCADRGYEGYAVESISYEYTAQNRVAAARQALQEAQDECYFQGSTYAQIAGPPQIVSVGGSERFRATQSFYCVGMRGED